MTPQPKSSALTPVQYNQLIAAIVKAIPASELKICECLDKENCEHTYPSFDPGLEDVLRAMPDGWFRETSHKRDGVLSIGYDDIDKMGFLNWVLGKPFSEQDLRFLFSLLCE